MRIFEENARSFGEKSERLGKILRVLSIARLIVFLTAIVILIYFVNERQFATGLWSFLGLMVLFLFLLRLYGNYFERNQNALNLKKINHDELSKLENNLSGFPDGKKYEDPEHDYHYDLDLFGDHSLFQLINRATTSSGQKKLAAWLSVPAQGNEIRERQDAVKDIQDNVDWRQQFQASGMPFEDPDSEYIALVEWMHAPFRIHKKRVLIYVGAITMALLAVFSLVYFFYNAISNGSLPFIPLVLSLFINYLMLRAVRKVAEEIAGFTLQNYWLLNAYEAMIRVVGKGKFSSKRLSKLQQTFISQKYQASKEISKIRNILEVFQQRGMRGKSVGGNAYYHLLNLFLLIDVFCVLMLEQWKYKNRERIELWAESLSEIEALTSLAGFAYDLPVKSYPELREHVSELHFIRVGHPLITEKERIYNDLKFNDSDKVVMITGSNMSGKSTFLRTVGINMVLGFCGAPCCAEHAVIPQVSLFSSMRTEDNLHQGVSSFYAELKRIEKLIKKTASGEKVFFLLDEMFKGTNSEDRYKGGISLIIQLKNADAAGLISTHDIALAELVGSKLGVSNYSFNSKISKGKMHFDYKLTTGICKDFSASELMKRIGINIVEGDF